VFIKLHRINYHHGKYYLSEIVVNVSHVTYLMENRNYRTALLEGRIDIGLDNNAVFTDIVINKNGISDTITVVGDMGLIESKIGKSTKTLLRD